MLSALEKKDAEALTLLRSSGEIQLLESIRLNKDAQIREANENLEGLNKSRAVVETHRNYYRDIAYINDNEQSHLNLTVAALVAHTIGQAMEMAASASHIVPDQFVGELAAGMASGMMHFRKSLVGQVWVRA